MTKPTYKPWTCSRCHTDNHGESPECIICFNKRPPEAVIPPIDEYQVVEVFSDGKEFPIGSVINIAGKPVFYRDISNKAMLQKVEWAALYCDCAVLDLLKERGIEWINYYNFDTEMLFVANIKDFDNIRPVEMACRNQISRLQKGLPLNRWGIAKKTFTTKRPAKKVKIKMPEPKPDETSTP